MKKLYLILSVLLLVSCSGEPSAEAIEKAIRQTQEAEKELQPTRTPRPTATPEFVFDCEDEISINNDWTTIYCDNFDDDRNDWEASDSDELTSNIYQVEDGKLIVDFTGKVNQSFKSGVVQWTTFSESKDFTVSIKGVIISNFDSATWGVNFGGKGDEFYSFMISNFGSYWLDMLDNEGWTQLIPLKNHSAIKWEEENEIVIVSENDEFSFYANGTLINTYEADVLKGEEISLAIWTAEGVTAKFEFDDIVVKVP